MQMDVIQLVQILYLKVDGDMKITLDITKDETGTLVCISNKELGIDTYGSTLIDAFSMLYYEVRVLWLEYALEDNNVLTPDAQKLKHAWLDLMDTIEGE